MMIAHSSYNILKMTFAIMITVVVMTFSASLAQAQIGGYTIVCGQTPDKQPIQCNTATHRCYKCKDKSGWFVKKRIYYTYNCLSRSADVPSNCEVANTGGLTGDMDVRIFWIKRNKAHVEGTNCVTENLMAMYSSTCYSCEIVSTLTSAFIRAAAKAYEVSRQAGNVILVVGMILWIAFFVLKNISSFTTVEPMKMLQDLLIQLFKIFIAFVIVNSGIPTILHYTLEPIMLAGTDFGNAIITANVGVNRSATIKAQEELRKQKEEETRKTTQEINQQMGFFNYGQNGGEQ